MTWGFQLVVRPPSAKQIAGDADQTWALPIPVGNVDLTIQPPRPPGGPMELVFRGGGFPSEEEAERAGRAFRDWLRLADALEAFGFDLGKDTPVSMVGTAVRPDLEARLATEGGFLVDDVHGLITYEERGDRPLRFAMRARAIVSQSSDSLREAVARASASPDLTSELSIACDLVSLMARESSDRGRLLTLVAAMEVLAEQPERTGSVLALVDGFINEAKKAHDESLVQHEKEELNSLLSSLSYLRNISISASVRELAARVRPGDPNVGALVTRSYKCRSELVHDGTSKQDPSALWPDLLQLLQEAIIYLLANRATKTNLSSGSSTG